MDTLPAGAFTWINKGAIPQWAILADQAQQMSDPQMITQAVYEAGGVIKTAMQDLIYGQPSLDEYADVAEQLTVFEEGNNVFVGIPPQVTTMVRRAEEMDTVFPVKDVAFDQDDQTGNAGKAFEQYLIDRTF
jgi:hypothetical protein